MQNEWMSVLVRAGVSEDRVISVATVLSAMPGT